MVVALFVGNDLWENLHPDSLGVAGGELVEKGEQKEHGWWRTTRNKSRLYRVFKRLPETVGDALSGDSTQARWYHRIERTRMAVCSTVAAEEWEPAWAATRAALAKVKALAGSRPCVLLVIPDEFQVEQELWERVAALQEDGVELDRDQPQRVLDAWFEAAR